jgi:hypothetical protein
VLICTSFQLEPRIWPDAISRRIRHRNSITLCADLGNCGTETPATIRQAFGEESKQESIFTETERWGNRCRAKSRACSLFSLTSKAFVLASQTVNSAYYCDLLRRLRENLRRLLLELWRQKNWLLHHDNKPSHTSFFTSEFFTKNNMAAAPPILLFPVSPTEDKTERPPF